jgi:peptidyl-prolyl cis-trans isomerase SurA
MNRSTVVSRANRRVVAALAAVALLASACRSTPSAPPARAVPADTWATVDGRDITREQVEKEFRRLRPGSETLSEAETLVAKLGVLEDLIVEQIILARAPALNVALPDTELDAAYAAAKKEVSDEAFQKELTSRNLTAADMRDGLRRELLGRKVMEKEIASKITVTDQEIADYFNANRAQFNLPEDAYHLAQIIVTPVREPQPANRTGDDATTPQAAAAKVGMLMERLKAGAPFADLARDYSEDPASAQRGGDLGLVPLSQIKKAPPLLRQAAMTTSTGAARVVNEGGVLTIVFIVAREAAGQRDLSTPGVRDRIGAGLRAEREQVLRAAYLAASRADADVTNYLARRLVDSAGKRSTP